MTRRVAQSNATFRLSPLRHIVLLEHHTDAHCGRLASFAYHCRRSVVSQNILLVSLRHFRTKCVSRDLSCGHWTAGESLGQTYLTQMSLRLQNKILRMATNAPWYVPNHVLHSDLQMPTIREEISRLSSNYKAKIEVHPNKLTTSLFEKQGPGRLRRYSPAELSTRFTP